MPSGEQPGVAFAFWRRVRAEQATRGWTEDELHAKSGVARTTVNGLKTGKRTPTARVVNALADALGINRREAHELAGIVPHAPRDAEGRIVSVREAILASDYSERQRETLLRVLEVIDQANQSKQQPEDQTG